ncbi:STAS domain-containing protein [Chloroflexia bacterium SDU3-3]|nr:STAS domain-containing protein [Chloroflexia bacterium SDU3-3]
MDGGMHISMTQRQAGIGLLAIASAGAWLATVAALLQRASMIDLLPNLVGGLLFTGLLLAYRANWLASIIPPLTISIYTLILIFGIPADFVVNQVSLAIITPALLAAVLLDFRWILGCGLAIFLGLGLRVGWQGAIVSPTNVVIFIACLAMICVIRLVTTTALRSSQQNQRRAEEALAVAEARSREAEGANRELQQQAEAQKRMLDLIDALETPVTPIADGVLLAPILGYIDARRASHLNRRILDAVYKQRAQLIVMDLSGLTEADISVASALIQMIQSVRLLGTDVLLCGVSGSLAMAMAKMDLPIGDVQTVATPQAALEYARQRSAAPKARA